MRYEPREFQDIFTSYIIEHQRCQGFLDMGMGKTVSTLTAADILWLAGSNLSPMLAIAPLRVARDVWPGEVDKWDHLNGLEVSPIIGTTPKQRSAALRKKADIYTINYENVPWLIEQFPKGRWPFKMGVADESTRLKGFRLRKGTKRSTALSKVARLTGRWLNLTGTPAYKLIDLWGPMYFVDFGARLGTSFTKFKDRWFDENVYAHSITPKANAASEIAELIKDCSVTLRARDWFQFDDPIPIPVYFDLPYRARQLYSSMENTMYAELGPDIAVEAMTAAAKSGKCMQMANGAVYTDDKGNWEPVHDAKFVKLNEIIDEVGDEPVMIAYWFKSDLARLRERYPCARVLDTKQDEDDWNAGKIAKLLVHPQSVGHGLNLQDGGFIIIFFSQLWPAELREQIIERIGPVRQLQSGHPRPVLVYDIIARNTVDECAQARYYENLSVQDALKIATRWRG